MENNSYLAKDTAPSQAIDIKDFRRDIGGAFSSMSTTALFALIAIGYTLVTILGAWMGRNRLQGGITEAETALETAVASVLGLLAFILGFTFSLTWSRFATRNSLVVSHAKAISTCYLRAGLIPEKQKLTTRSLLAEYTAILQAIQSTPDLNRSLVRLDEINLLLWEQAVSLAKEDLDSELRSLFTAAINDLIIVSIHRKIVALFIRIPNAIWVGILFLAFIGMFAFGYQAGIGGIRKFFQLPLLPVAFSLVMVLIADLNKADSKGHFKVTRQPLKEVMEMMKRIMP